MAEDKKYSGTIKISASRPTSPSISVGEHSGTIKIEASRTNDATISVIGNNNAEIGVSTYANNYEALRNKPKINGETLIGNKTSDQLHLQDKLIGTQTEGQNIKTINGECILGAGDIQVTPGNYLKNAQVSQDGRTLTITKQDDSTIIYSDADLDQKITTEKSERQAADITLAQSISSEVTRATQKENIIEANLTAEIDRATAEETRLANLIDTKQDKITTQNKLSSDLVNDIGKQNKFVTAAEKSDIAQTKSRVDVIESKIPAEASVTNKLADKAYVETHGGKIDKIKVQGIEQEIINKEVDLNVATKTQLDTEVSRAEGKEAELSTNIATEGNERRAADLTLQTNINNEASTRSAADTTLQTAINTEKSRAEGVESGLNTRLATIESDYLTSTDKTELSGLISTEKTRAETAEQALGTRLTTAEGKITTIESDYLKAADKTELEGKITAEETRAKAEEEDLDERIRNLESRGRFLSGWNSNTGLPTTEPTTELPYTYRAGDYYIIEVCAAGNLYQPDGSQYTGDPSTKAETREVSIGDYYTYDSNRWIWIANSTKTVSFANIAGDAEDNINLKGKLDAKATVTSVNTLAGRVTTVEGKVSTIEDDYLTSTDKAELQTQIDTKTSINDTATTSTTTTFSANKTSTLITDEASLRSTADTALNTRIDDLDGSSQVATVSEGVITLKGVTQTDGLVGTGADITTTYDKTTTDGFIKYTNTNGTTVAVGGIPKGTTFNNEKVLDILENMLYPYVAFTFNSISTVDGAGTFEYGTSKNITKVTPSFTLGSKSINSVKIGTTSGGSDLYEGTTATSGSAIILTTSTSWDGTTSKTIYCTLSDSKTTTTRSATFSPAYYTYYKVTSDTTAPTSGCVKTNSTTSGDSTITTQNNTYIWFLTKNPKTKIQQYVTGQWNDMNTTTVGTVSLTLSSGAIVAYYAYRTDEMMSATSRYQIV